MNAKRPPNPYAPILISTKLGVSGSAENKYLDLGWSKREQFACHAPIEIPEWFQVKPPDDSVSAIGPEVERQRYFLWRYYFADTMLQFGEIE